MPYSQTGPEGGVRNEDAIITHAKVIPPAGRSWTLALA